MSSGKAQTIRLHLPDGDPDSICIADIVMSRIQAVSFHRDQLRDIRMNQEIHDIDKPGIYILIGSNEYDDVDNVAYIGQSNNVGGERLPYHKSPKPEDEVKVAFWERTVVLTTNDESMSTGNMNHIEAELIRIARKNLRWETTNKNDPTYDSTKLSAIDRDFINKFVDLATTLVRSLGWDLFRTTSEHGSHKDQQNQEEGKDQSPSIFTYRTSTAGENGETFVCTLRGEIIAKMIPVSTKSIVVMKDSKAKISMAESSSENLKKVHAALVKNNVLIEDGKRLVFSRDYEFSSVSAAASIIKGSNWNGRTEWKLASDRKTTYDEWQKSLDEKNYNEFFK